MAAVVYTVTKWRCSDYFTTSLMSTVCSIRTATNLEKLGNLIVASEKVRKNGKRVACGVLSWLWCHRISIAWLDLQCKKIRWCYQEQWFHLTQNLKKCSHVLSCSVTVTNTPRPICILLPCVINIWKSRNLMRTEKWPPCKMSFITFLSRWWCCIIVHMEAIGS